MLGYSHGLVKRLKLNAFQEIPASAQDGSGAVGALLPGRSDSSRPPASASPAKAQRPDDQGRLSHVPALG